MFRRGVWELVAIICALGLSGCGQPASLSPAETAAATAVVTAALVVATPGPAPANAEPYGRAWGPPDAPIRVLKFIDYQCPTCGRESGEFEPAVAEAFAATGKVRYEVHPLAFIGRESYDAALAALCAADQNAFWRMHRSLFLNQPFDGRENTGVYTKDALRGMAAQMGLDREAFDRCLSSEQHKAVIDQERDEARRYGVSRVPAVVVNGTFYSRARSVDDLRRIFAQVAPG